MAKETQITQPKPKPAAGETKRTVGEDGKPLTVPEMIRIAREKGVIADIGDSFTKAGELEESKPPPFRATGLVTPAQMMAFAAEFDAADKLAAESENPPEDDGTRTVEQWAVRKGDVKQGYMNPMLAAARICNHWAVGKRLTEDEYALGLRIAGAVPLGGPKIVPSVMAVAPAKKPHAAAPDAPPADEPK